MTRIPVPIAVISETQRDHYLEIGYNGPEGEYDEEAFRAECQSASDKVKTALEAHFKLSSLGECGFSMDKDVSEMDFESEVTCEGDFSMNEEFGSTRFLCIEVCTEDILTPKLLHVVHEAISKIEPDYSVDICDAFYVLKTKDGSLYPRFNIFVEKHRMLIYSESRHLFDRLGIPYPAENDEERKEER